MGEFEQVGQFVYDDVFETMAGFAGEAGVEADAGGDGSTTAPLCDQAWGVALCRIRYHSSRIS